MMNSDYSASSGKIKKVYRRGLKIWLEFIDGEKVDADFNDITLCVQSMKNLCMVKKNEEIFTINWGKR